MKTFILRLSLVINVVIANSGIELQKKSSQSTTYEDVRKNERFSGAPMKTVKFGSANGCSMICHRHPECRSFTFCQRLTCELFRDDVFSTAEYDAKLITDPSCKYVGMRKDEIPFCKEGKSVISIQDSSNNSDCRISLKRVDREWTQWSQTDETVDTGAEYKEMKIFERDITVLEAHGGKTGNDTRNRYTETLYWLTFVKQRMNFSDAKANCESNSGHLFYDIDGTIKQLKWLFEKMDKKHYWLGIYTEDFNNWISLDGEVLNSKLLWMPGQPNNFDGQEKHVASGGRYGKKLGDMPAYRKFYSVCHIV